jgi:hypothetical protein
MVRQVWDIRSYGKLLRRRSRVYLMFRNWRVFMTGIGLFLLAISAVAWGAWVHRAWRARMLADADTVDATVLAKDVETLEITDTWHGNGGIEQSFFLTYRFTDPAGRTVTTRREVSRSDWDPVHEGGPIPGRRWACRSSDRGSSPRSGWGC